MGEQLVFVLFRLRTSIVGCDVNEVYEFDEESGVLCPDGTINDEYLSEVGYDLARDNAEINGVDDDSDESFSFTFEILNDTRENIIDEYGEIMQV